MHDRKAAERAFFNAHEGDPAHPYWTTEAGLERKARRMAWLVNDAGLAPGRRVLEIGCGAGTFTEELAKTGATVTAIDLSDALIAQARARVPGDNVTIRAVDAEATGFADGSFDAVVGMSILHHLNVGPALAEAWRVLAPGGALVFSEPNMLNPQVAVEKNVKFIGRRLGNSPDETAFFRWPLKLALERAGFVDVSITPFDFLHPLTPPRWLPVVSALAGVLERVPGVRELAGSLWVRAQKPRG